MDEAVRHRKIVARMNEIDGWPKDLRELVHEYGYTVVKAFVDLKIVRAVAVRHLIEQVRRGSIDVGAGGANYTGGRALVVIPREPNLAMIEASMAEVSNFNTVVDKYEKHRLRLRAAIKAGVVRVL